MKFVCVVLAVTCWAVAAAREETPTVLTLSKVMNELSKLEREYSKGAVTDKLIISPTVNNMKDCCIASALQCFASQVIYLPVSTTTSPQLVIQRQLKKKMILENVSSCRNETEKAQCTPCKENPKVDGHTYLENFQTLLQKIFVRLQ